MPVLLRASPLCFSRTGVLYASVQEKCEWLRRECMQDARTALEALDQPIPARRFDTTRGLHGTTREDL
jgi:hypothetical protein